jgi:hypothetical protein
MPRNHFFGGRTLTRQKWNRELRWTILERLLSIPRELQIAVVAGLTESSHTKADKNLKSARVRQRYQHALAFMWCAIAAEGYMRKATKDEVALIIAENTSDSRNMLKTSHDLLRDPNSPFAGNAPEFSDYLPFERIVDSVVFAEKARSPLLQLADACASMHNFTVRRSSGANSSPCVAMAEGVRASHRPDAQWGVPRTRSGGRSGPQAKSGGNSACTTASCAQS